MKENNSTLLKNIKNAKNSLKIQIEFLKSVEESLSGENTNQLIFAVCTAWVLQNYMQHKLKEDIEKIIKEKKNG